MYQISAAQIWLYLSHYAKDAHDRSHSILALREEYRLIEIRTFTHLLNHSSSHELAKQGDPITT
jgi:hypothetical protein